ncbi:exodeoxyribonuclease VII large subunit [Staphylococcus lutrae]|uniref:Exodeoxyribonuclease 7 large subunit n=1 Tax=Staphylococcus lutrae TaxID=155085 RepID=A0AAC9RT23_9STAP|nr:exodeoxyribonuclease VII large subunit [Staphylococcus lutrae]ARJ51928.1 exodeoxyribonuclease VII large subunit [Staphylococcus lutrae]PNZ37392.1 exodeoxyribonuclease VII large subunit [Staphylococcus lutrae]
MEKYLTISALTKYIKYKFDQDPHLQSVYIKGELSNFKRHSSGHLYFAVKDENSVIAAMMFKSQAAQLDFNPKEGDQVLLEARVSVYERRGNYQIYVNQMQLDGVGNLYQKFEQLKIKLTKEGYFDPSNKKSIPKYPQKIAILTANTGAAIRDIQNTLNSRYPLAEQIKISTLVQGAHAKNDIIEKLKIADESGADVIILGRGGGSIEDLWNFNEEDVVKAIYSCKTPVISAVGHETDTTLSDFVADLRAATPTQAAMLATPDQQELKQVLLKTKVYLDRFIKQQLKHLTQQLKQLQSYYKFKQPGLLYEQQTQKRDDLDRMLHQTMLMRLQNEKQQLMLMQQHIRLQHFYESVQRQKQNCITLSTQLDKQIHRVLTSQRQQLEHRLLSLDNLSPTKTMLRGYSIVKKDNHVLTSSRGVKKGDHIEVTMKDGTIAAKIEEVRWQTDD